MTLPEPELADGAVDPEERPLPVLVLELPEPELPDVPEAELPDVPVLAAELPEAADPELAEVAWCAPGSANAITPAAATLAIPAVAVTVRSRAWPRSRSATARLVSCGCLLIEWVLSGSVRN